MERTKQSLAALGSVSLAWMTQAMPVIDQLLGLVCILGGSDFFSYPDWLDSEPQHSIPGQKVGVQNPSVPPCFGFMVLWIISAKLTT